MMRKKKGQALMELMIIIAVVIAVVFIVAKAFVTPDSTSASAGAGHLNKALGNVADTMTEAAALVPGAVVP
jgi:Tfp pilus assembly protein PilE